MTPAYLLNREERVVAARNLRPLSLAIEIRTQSMRTIT
ncbi:hypothetical protein RISK_001825 [Rhodopirellula islandica]|uniref:Uncharacterized protein n=1 Tax=Rhodopirellula islandica TaxID=595434 RepID=A0A0J1EKC7_RHOIS|nr:hypothetical protein RISK_001825 [Rhodopirellula islandica]